MGAGALLMVRAWKFPSSKENVIDLLAQLDTAPLNLALQYLALLRDEDRCGLPELNPMLVYAERSFMELTSW